MGTKAMGKNWLNSGAAAAAMMMFAHAVPAYAQEQTYSFNIPAQDLGAALKAFARASHQQVTFDAKAVRGKRAPELRGTYSASAALGVLLAGSGLTADRGRSGLFIVRASATASNSGSSSVGEGDIIVTANKRNERLSEVPAAINVVTKNFLDEKAANRLTDYIGYLPNVQIQSEGATGYARIYIRGITVIGSGSSVGTYIDGIPFGSSTSFAAAANLQPDLDPSILASIEVLKGPQGTLYGAGSTGGLIKYSTIAPDTGRLGAGATLEGSFSDRGSGGYAVRAHINVPIVADVVALSISGYARQDPGFIDNLASGKRDENVTLSKGFHGALLIAPVDALTITASALYQSLRGDGLNSVPANPGTQGNQQGLQGSPVYGKYTTLLYADPGNVAHDELYGLDIEYRLPFANLSSLTSYSTLSGTLSVGDSGYVYQDWGLTPDDHVVQKIGGHTRKVTQELRLTSPDAGLFKWMIGGFFTHENSTGTLALTANLDTGPDLSVAPGGNVYARVIPSTYTEYSGFANATLTILPRVDVTVGGRYSGYQQHYTQLRSGANGNPADPGTLARYADTSASDHALTYVAAIKYSLPGNNGLVYARNASGYRVGGPTVLPLGAVPPAGFTGSFKPEKLINYEIGFRRDFFNARLSLDISAFYIDYRDLQGNVRLGRFTITGNPGGATSKGIEASVRARIVRGLSVSGAFGYDESTLNEDSPAFGALKGDTLPNAPRYTASGNVEYSIPVGDAFTLFTNAGLRYVSSQVGGFSSTQELTFPGSTVADLQFGLHDHGFTAVLYVKNVTNSYQYEGDVRATTVGPAYVAVTPPRVIGLRLSREF